MNIIDNINNNFLKYSTILGKKYYPSNPTIYYKYPEFEFFYKNFFNFILSNTNKLKIYVDEFLGENCAKIKKIYDFFLSTDRFYYICEFEIGKIIFMNQNIINHDSYNIGLIIDKNREKHYYIGYIETNGIQQDYIKFEKDDGKYPIQLLKVDNEKILFDMLFYYLK